MVYTRGFCLIRPALLKNKTMTVKELIEALGKAKDVDLAEITFLIKGDDDTCYELDGISQFSISPDVNITIREYVPPLIKPLIVRRDKIDMVNKKMKEIRDDL